MLFVKLLLKLKKKRINRMTEHELMLTSVLDCRRMDLYGKEIELSEDQERRLREMESRRAGGEPLQYVIGEAEFCRWRPGNDGYEDRSGCSGRRYVRSR